MKKRILFNIFISTCLYAVPEINLDTTFIISDTAAFEETIIEEKKNTFIITAEDIKNKHYSNIEEIFKNSPNIIFQQTQFGPVINLRGSGDYSINKVKIIVDGIALNPLEGAMGALSLNSIQINSIEKIEIIPSGRTINITTKANTKKEFLTADVKYSSFAAKNIDFAFGQILSDDLYINFSNSYLNKNGYRDNEKTESNNFSGGFDYKINDSSKIKFQLSHYNDRAGSSSDILKNIMEYDRKKAGDPINSQNEKTSVSLDYEFKPLKNWTIFTNFFKTESERDVSQITVMTGEQIKKITQNVLPFPILNIDNNISNTMNGRFIEKTEGIKIKSKYQYDNGSFVLGYDYIHEKLKRYNLVNADEFNMSINIGGRPVSGKVNMNVNTHVNMAKDTHAFYGLNEYSFNDNLTLTTGMRYENADYTGNRSSKINAEAMNRPMNIPANTSSVDKNIDNAAGEIELAYKYRDTGNIYTRYEKGFFSPLPIQLTNKNSSGIYQSSNIKSEDTNNFELGFRDFIGDNFYLSSTFFIIQTNNEIVNIEQNSYNPALKYWKFANIDQTERIGFDIYFEQFFDKITFNQSVSYIDTRIKKAGKDVDGYFNEGEKIPMVPEWKITFGINYKFSEKLSLGGIYTYNSGYEKRELETFDRYKVSGYGILNVYGQYKLSENIDFNFGINNILNKKYNYFETKTTAIPAPEINYYLGFKMEF